MLSAALAWVLVAALPLACARRKPVSHAPSPVASPVVRGADRGLELWWWVVADPRPETKEVQSDSPPNPDEPVRTRTFALTEAGKPLEQALAPFLSRATPVDDATRSRWRAHGFRIVSVPLSDLDAVQASLHISGPVHRQWFGEVSAWTDIVRGPEFPQPKVVMLGDSPEELRPGRLRMLARCWVYPIMSGAGGTPTAGLRLELVPEYEPSPDERARLQVAAAARGAREEPSRVFRELLAGLSIEPDDKLAVRAPGSTARGDPDAILIIPEEPAADWRRARDANEAGDQPQMEYPPTLGEAMLSVPPMRTSSGVVPRSRAVIILIPRLPEKFELLGR